MRVRGHVFKYVYIVLKSMRQKRLSTSRKFLSMSQHCSWNLWEDWEVLRKCFSSFLIQRTKMLKYELKHTKAINLLDLACMFVCASGKSGLLVSHSNDVAQGRRHFSKTFLPRKSRNLQSRQTLSAWINKFFCSTATRTERVCQCCQTLKCNLSFASKWVAICCDSFQAETESEVVAKKWCKPPKLSFLWHPCRFSVQNPRNVDFWKLVPPQC